MLEQIEVVLVGDGGGELLQVILEVADRPQDFHAILVENLSPELGAAGGYSRGIAEPIAAIFRRSGTTFREEGSQ